EDAAARGIVLRLPGPTGVRDGVRVIAPVTESAAYLDLLADGTPLAFGSAGAPEAADPWDWVRGAARTSPAAQRISDRAAFLAATRGGQRVAGNRHPGSLQTGLPATFVVWEPWDLTVQSKAERVDSWSTDPRSRTPLLPDLDQGTPRALRTVVEGRILHDRPQDLPREQGEAGPRPPQRPDRADAPPGPATSSTPHRGRWRCCAAPGAASAPCSPSLRTTCGCCCPSRSPCSATGCWCARPGSRAWSRCCGGWRCSCP